ncbi:ribulose-phosphate 3-epimerase [Labrys wisconsinensis]|uniref:Ribulose-phosphate 3-epimerase n=1 Tax=Labrys wisconsinensis TaxID=425677 RepID=A0ABU0JJT2_9HYPH|nr:ribulose-phosphate 3-epimerase [Labrys wisconsinensis]MDQ0474547.1 ribulose-phosphate 3-epimerase [Labrys wisconsinensis]
MSPTWIDVLPRERLIGEFSMWSADLVRLADDLVRIAPHADVLHIDVADGHFAPALLYFPDLVAAVKRTSALPVHVHLMAADAILLPQVDQFVEAGSDLVSVHLENANAGAALDRLEAAGVPAGLVLQVDTPVAAVAPYLPRLSFVTLLGTAIGIKGVGLDARATARLTEAKMLIAASGAGRRIVLAADGGIREHTVPLLRSAGAETVVLGSLAFGAPDLSARMAWLHGL